MVPYSERRHRLNPDEIEPVRDAAHDMLVSLLELRDPSTLDEAGSLFRIWYRIARYVRNKPSYPPHESWDEIALQLTYGTVNGVMEAEMMRRFEEGKEDPMGTFKVTPIHESLEEDLAKCSVCSKDVPRTLYCINCGAPIEVKKEAEP